MILRLTPKTAALVGPSPACRRSFAGALSGRLIELGYIKPMRQAGRGSTELSTLSAGAGVAACLPSMSRTQIWRTLRKMLLCGAYSFRVNHSA